MGNTLPVERLFGSTAPPRGTNSSVRYAPVGPTQQSAQPMSQDELETCFNQFKEMLRTLDTKLQKYNGVMREQIKNGDRAGATRVYAYIHTLKARIGAQRDVLLKTEEHYDAIFTQRMTIDGVKILRAMLVQAVQAAQAAGETPDSAADLVDEMNELTEETDAIQRELSANTRNTVTIDEDEMEREFDEMERALVQAPPPAGRVLQQPKPVAAAAAAPSGVTEEQRAKMKKWLAD